MTSRDLTALIHLVGFTTGVVLYAMLGVMTRRRLAYVSVTGDGRRPDGVPLVAAVLGVVWNVGAMLTYSARDFGFGELSPWISAAAYTALGALPAVVVHSTLNRSGVGMRRALLLVAYVASSVAAIMHGIAAWNGEPLSAAALLLLTCTYALLLVVLALTERGRPGAHRTITAVALAAFAVSALHLSRHAGLIDRDSWPVELVGHHASLPLVLAILYQDFRFAFADLFLKRALAILALMSLVGLLYGTLVAPIIAGHGAHGADRESHLIDTAAIIALWSVTALVFPLIQQWVFRFVDRVVLRRGDYRALRGALAQGIAASGDVDAVLATGCDLLGQALDARAVTWRSVADGAERDQTPITVGARRTDAKVRLSTRQQPSFEITIGELSEGRTLLSDDLVLLETASVTMARRIDELRFETERRLRNEREGEIQRLATEAELRALRAQVNPHFLFNALNTLGHLMTVSPDRATTTLYRLTALLRAVLRRTNGEFVALRDELEIVESYLAIEAERFEERLAIQIDVDDALLAARIPPLLLQPLVENAIKHGIAPVRQGGSVTVRAWREVAPRRGALTPMLHLLVIDTGRGFVEGDALDGGGVGLANIASRLQHYYGTAATLALRDTPGGGATVEVIIPSTAGDAASESASSGTDGAWSATDAADRDAGATLSSA